jgi:hypothetical protein
MNIKQILGIKPDVNPSIIALNDVEVIYVSGHNVIIHSIDQIAAQQRIIPGLEGCQSITAMALSPNKKEIAVCEKAENAVCVIYEMSTLKRRKILCSTDYASTTFTAVNFAKSSEKLNQFIVTITGEPDYRAIVWLWEKSRFIAQYKFEQDEIPLSCSF